MSFLKKPFDKLKNRHSRHSEPGSSNTSKENVNGTEKATEPQNGHTNGTSSPNPNRRVSKEVLREEKERRSLDKERVKVEAMKRAQLARIESANFLQTGPEDLTKLYKPYSMNMSKERNGEHRVLFKEIDFASKLPRQVGVYDKSWFVVEMEGKVITFRARIHTLRRMSAKLVFIVFRQQTITIQGVLQSFQQLSPEGKWIYIQKNTSIDFSRCQRTQWHNFRPHGKKCGKIP